MKQSINESQFRDAFINMGMKEQFSYNGLGALFEYLEQLGDDIGEEIELDVIALCCDFSEYTSALDCVKDCGYLKDYEIEGDDDDEKEEFCLDWLRDRTNVIEFTNDNQFSDLGSGIIIQSF